MFHKEITIFQKFNCKLKHKEKILSFFIYAIYLFSLLGCANIFGLQGEMLMISAFFMALSILLEGRMIIDKFSIGSIVFFTSYLLSFIINKAFTLNALFYTLYFIILNQFIYCFSRKKSVIFHLVLSISIGLFISSLFIVIATIWNQGFQFDGMNLNFFWTTNNDVFVSRTGLSLYGINLVAICSVLLIFKNKYKTRYTVPLFLFVILFTLVAGSVAGNRSLIVAYFILYFFIILFFLWNKSKKALNIFLAVVFVCVLLFFLFLFQIIPIPDFLMKITIIKRFFDSNYNSNSERFQIIVNFFNQFYKYPFGGMYNIDGFTYVHNIFLDFYAFGGIIPFLFSSFFFIDYIRRIIGIIKIKIYSLLSLLVIFTFVAIVGLGLFEPIFQANQNSLSIILIFYYSIVYSNNFLPEKIKIYSLEINC